MKKILCVFVLFMLFGVGFCEEKALTKPASQNSKELGTSQVKVFSDPLMKLANVNGNEILFRDVSELYLKNLKDIKAKGIELSAPMHDFLIKGLINEKIEEELMFEAALKQGIKPDEEKANEIFSKFSTKFKTEEEFKDYLKLRGMTEEEVRKKIQSRILVSEYQEFLFKEIKVTDEEALKYFTDNEPSINPPESFRVTQIMLYYPENSTEIEKSFLIEKLGGIRKKIISGANWEAEAKASSEGASAANGGMIGWIDATSKVEPVIIENLKKMKKGDISPVIKTANGVHILKVLDYRPAAPKKEFAEVREKLIENLTMQKKQEILAAFLEKAKKTSKIEMLL